MERWECYRCGYQVEADVPPEECPSCHYSVTFWLEHVEERTASLKDFVRTIPLTLDGSESVYNAVRMMQERDTENILVKINGEPIGIVTEKDVVNKVAAQDLTASKVTLSRIMSSPLLTVPSDASIADALMIMAAHHVRRVVVTEGGKPTGIVSHRSILGGSFRASTTPAE